jgi:hypothetical protein
MATETLTQERILEAAEEVLRRFGPAKANVVDVARALGVSHGSVYRHFPSVRPPSIWSGLSVGPANFESQTGGTAEQAGRRGGSRGHAVRDGAAADARVRPVSLFHPERSYLRAMARPPRNQAVRRLNSGRRCPSACPAPSNPGCRMRGGPDLSPASAPSGGSGTYRLFTVSPVILHRPRGRAFPGPS